jgi:hypothetical protein
MFTLQGERTTTWTAPPPPGLSHLIRGKDRQSLLTLQWVKVSVLDTAEAISARLLHPPTARRIEQAPRSPGAMHPSIKRERRLDVGRQLVSLQHSGLHPNNGVSLASTIPKQSHDAGCL